ncbi:MAG TPA: hypothetical protein VFB06_11190 [Streptosporangiaceae bacterium]|nr:hypothetical protein [Streptosporangiaceae bacterium]
MSEPKTPVDDMPIEVRRANWGWFGKPWWSYVCYDEAGRLIEEMRKPFPSGESCLLCDELFDEAAGDSGQATPCHTLEGSSIRHAHKECLMRNVLGSVACLEGHHNHDTGQTLRQEALKTWEWVQMRAHDSRLCGEPGSKP